jgi:hypothetical protein
MGNFIVSTDFYTIVPWITGGWIIFGIVAMITLSLALGWWVGIKSDTGKKGRMWFAFGWIPIFGIFVASVSIATNVYFAARNDLNAQIKSTSGINVITLVRGNESVFVGTKDDKLILCTLKDLKQGNKYTVICQT